MAETRQPLPPLSRASKPILDSDAEFTFAVMGDCRATLPTTPLPRVFHDIVRDMALLRPAFVLFAGDAIYGYGQTRQYLLNEYDRFRAAVAPAGIPFFNAPGNHEMQSEPTAVEALKAAGQALYGSFDIGRYHFIALNTDEVNLEQRVTGPQFEWLKADLELNKGAAGIFVWMHRPMDSWFRDDFNPDDRDALRGLFKKYPVKAVFAAHDHYFDTGEHDGIRYFTSGGAGAPVYAEPPKGGFAHYILVSVSPEAIAYTVVAPNFIDVAYTAGNDGIEPVTKARVMNMTASDLLARNLEFRVPRLSLPDRYRVSTLLRDDENRPVHHRAAIRSITDNQDGSVTLGVSVAMPGGTGFYVTVEAREPAPAK
ncbi:MAG: hypothetical protein QOE70_1287 [Chthoniobacter sp.]|jgi:hypothetical protein|nr:hypothetical protein [Chthoniobacter sp.]